jgi:hypothetical protein
MKSWKRKLLVAFGILSCFGVFAYLSKDFWQQQLRIYIFGSRDVAVEKYRMSLHDIDTVEVFTLSNEPSPKDTNGFYGDFTEPLGTIGHKTLTGTNANEVVELWRSQMGGTFPSLCFAPAYGLEFKRQGEIVFQTAICWRCSAYSLPVSLFGKTHIIQNGFYAKSESSQKLLETLQNELPLPPQPKKVQS